MVESNYYALLGHALAQCGDLQDRFCIMDIFNSGEDLVTSSDLDGAIGNFRNGFASAFNNYGAAYFPNLKTVYSYDYDEAQTNIVHTVDGNNGPFNGKSLKEISTPPSLTSPLSPVDSSFNLPAYNLLKQALNTQFPVVLPPSPAVAGIYAAVDATRGVWKAPAIYWFAGCDRNDFSDIR
jgi:hypothetical protein